MPKEGILKQQKAIAAHPNITTNNLFDTEPNSSSFNTESKDGEKGG